MEFCDKQIVLCLFLFSFCIVIAQECSCQDSCWGHWAVFGTNRVLVLSPKDKLDFKEEERFMDHICDLMVETGQAIQLFAYGQKDWHERHAVTPFYQSVQAEAIRL